MARWPQIEVLLADITTLDVDAIVNAANSSLLWWRRPRWRRPSGGRGRRCVPNAQRFQAAAGLARRRSSAAISSLPAT